MIDKMITRYEIVGIDRLLDSDDEPYRFEVYVTFPLHNTGYSHSMVGLGCNKLCFKADDISDKLFRVLSSDTCLNGSLDVSYDGLGCPISYEYNVYL